MIAGTYQSLWSEPNTATVVPLRATLNGNTYITEGAYPSLREAALMFYATSRNMPQPPLKAGVVDATKVQYPGEWKDSTGANTLITTANTQTTSMQAVMLLSFAGLNPGNDSFSPVF